MTVLAQVPSNLSPCISMEKVLHNNHGENFLELVHFLFRFEHGIFTVSFVMQLYLSRKNITKSSNYFLHVRC